MKHCRCGVKYTHEYAILPNQGLTELRDVFKCVHDFGVSVELQHPDEKITLNTKVFEIKFENSTYLLYYFRMNIHLVLFS